MSTTHATISMAWDHPREYGENLNLYGLIAFSMGSSPRIRGEFHPVFDGLRGGRIIPANTGRIAGGGCRRSGRWDHPREYGENGDVERGIQAVEGSSPRIRGEYASEGQSVLVLGIIPANTGRMSGLVLTLSLLRDHPREYGENEYYTRNNIHGVGSSPRIRGEFESVWADCVFHGIIPANTGRISPCV